MSAASLNYNVAFSWKGGLAAISWSVTIHINHLNPLKLLWPWRFIAGKLCRITQMQIFNAKTSGDHVSEWNLMTRSTVVEIMDQVGEQWATVQSWLNFLIQKLNCDINTHSYIQPKYHSDITDVKIHENINIMLFFPRYIKRFKVRKVILKNTLLK